MFGLQSKKIKGQSTLELTIALVVIIILLAGMVRLFIWLSRSIIGRQKAYMGDYKENIEKPYEFYSPKRTSIVPKTVYPE